MDEGWGQEGAVCGGGCAVKEKGGDREVVPLLCGRWSCPVCGRIRYRWFVRNVADAVKRHELGYFWTLTINHGTNTPAESWDLVMAAWNRFRTAMKRRYPTWEYLWVVEPQRSGHAHLHVLWNLRVSHGLVKELWRDATRGSYVVWVERVTSADVARYLAKYVSKLSGRILEVPGMGELVGRHRYGKSHTIAFAPFRKPAGGWEYMDCAYKPYLAFARRSGRLIDSSDGWVPRFTLRLEPADGWPWQPRPGPVPLVVDQLE